MNTPLPDNEQDALWLIMSPREDNVNKIDLQEKINDIEYFYVLRAMQENNYNQTRATESLNIKRETLIAKCKKYRII